MSCSKYWRAELILRQKEEMWLKLNSKLPRTSGIYILTRVDENGIRFAYIGQTKAKGGILRRLAQHLYEYPPQHIDLSLKKHKLYNAIENPYGWNVDFIVCADEQVDELERKYIYEYAQKGFQLRNKTSGGQNQGKAGIDDNKASKGYYDGVAYGKEVAMREVKLFFDKYLNYSIKPELVKKNGEFTETAKRKFNEFGEMLKGEKTDAESESIEM